MGNGGENQINVAFDPITATIGALETGANMLYNHHEAKIDREFQKEMYERQLDDSIAWRTHTEQYNSPEAVMKRYADAGINPMYAVTGSGSNQVSQPFSVGGGKFGTSTPSSNSHRLAEDAVLGSRIKNENKIASAQVDYYKAMANKEQSEANLNEAKLPEAQYQRDVVNAFTAWRDAEGKTMAWNEGFLRMDYLMFKAQEYQDMTFNDARDKFLHDKYVRQFERDLSDHKRSMFEHELSQCKSAAEVFAVSARWAVANQWINAGGQLLDAAAGFLGAFKGTAILPGVQQSFNTSNSTVNSTSNSYNVNKNYTYKRYTDGL